MPEVIKDIGKYVDRYNLCQKMKNRMKTSVGKANGEWDIREAIDVMNYKVYTRELNRELCTR